MKDIQLIFDLDDTLIVTNQEYEKTNCQIGKILYRAFKGKIPLNQILKTQRRIDIKLIQKYGFLSNNYLYSWKQTYKKLSKKANLKISDSVIKEIEIETEQLFKKKFHPLPCVHEVLTQLKNKGYSMAICTAGENSLQLQKISNASLNKYFKKVFVFPKKTPETLKKVMDALPAKKYVMIGNSLRSDIYPALKNRVIGIHLKRKTWEIDDYAIDKHHPLYFSIDSIEELPNLLSLLFPYS